MHLDEVAMLKRGVPRASAAIAGTLPQLQPLLDPHAPVDVFPSASAVRGAASGGSEAGGPIAGTTKRQQGRFARNHLRIGLFVASLLLSSGVMAQALIGQFGNACTTLGPSSTMTLTTTQPIPAGALIIVSVGIDGTPFENAVTDNAAGGGFYSLGSVGTLNGALLIPFSRFNTSIVPAGTTFTWTMTGGSTRRACMNISAFSGLLPPQAIPVAMGINTGISTSASATTDSPIGTGHALVFQLTTYQSDPDTLTPSPGTTLLTKNCLGAPAFCLQTGYRVTSSHTAQTQTTTSSLSANWQMGVNAYLSNTIHRDGFE
jgi:hypothetical protein